MFVATLYINPRTDAQLCTSEIALCTRRERAQTLWKTQRRNAPRTREAEASCQERSLRIYIYYVVLLEEVLEEEVENNFAKNEALLQQWEEGETVVWDSIPFIFFFVSPFGAVQ